MQTTIIPARERSEGQETLDRLEREGGLCLVFAHMGAGSFNRGSGVDPRFEARIKDLASRNGWFAPASEILDYLQQQPGFEADLDFVFDIAPRRAPLGRFRLTTKLLSAVFTLASSPMLIKEPLGVLNWS